jgi:hypothetical protein
MENNLKYKINSSFLKLKYYCEQEKFKGWDPYDGLNSKIFQALPLKKWDIARLVWIQLFKRSPVNFRKLLLVPKVYNPKGIGLLLSGYCNLYKIASKGNFDYGSKEEILTQINFLCDKLIEIQNKNYSGACWGYPFDWQARRLFLFPKGTPNIVTTTFCFNALVEAFEITKNEIYLKTALSSANFVLKDLKRTTHNNGFLFSYSPIDGNNTVFNASLMGAMVLSKCYTYTKNKEYIESAKIAVDSVCNSQNLEGSWRYGMLPVQNWIDSFHTGYVLDAIQAYHNASNDFCFQESIEKGFDFYINNFFLTDGTPKYYHNKTYPIDIHCPGQFLVTLSKLGKTKQHIDLAKKVTLWTIDNMQDKEGYFYYQLKRGISSKISYMRWSNAYMFYAISYLLLDENL